MVRVFYFCITTCEVVCDEDDASDDDEFCGIYFTPLQLWYNIHHTPLVLSPSNTAQPRRLRRYH